MNDRSKKSSRIKEPLMTAETREQIKWSIKQEKERCSANEKFIEDQQELNIHKSGDGLF